MLPINTDKFVVLAKGDMTYTPPRDDLPAGPTAGKADRTILVDKVINYRKETANTAINPIVFVWYVTDWSEVSTLVQPASSTESYDVLVEYHDLI